MHYFLGIINEESLALESEKSILKRKLLLEKRALEERMLQGGGMQRATSLISEAKYVGLLELDANVDYERATSHYMKILLKLMSGNQ
jgi:hypothetical protein